MEITGHDCMIIVIARLIIIAHCCTGTVFFVSKCNYVRGGERRDGEKRRWGCHYTSLFAILAAHDSPRLHDQASPGRLYYYNYIARMQQRKPPGLAVYTVM